MPVIVELLVFEWVVSTLVYSWKSYYEGFKLPGRVFFLVEMLVTTIFVHLLCYFQTFHPSNFILLQHVSSLEDVSFHKFVAASWLLLNILWKAMLFIQ